MCISNTQIFTLQTPERGIITIKPRTAYHLNQKRGKNSLCGKKNDFALMCIENWYVFYRVNHKLVSKNLTLLILKNNKLVFNIKKLKWSTITQLAFFFLMMAYSLDYQIHS